ncbi:jouberin-like [Prorops nasuta]|uniref:jouberin-like n=1 Tax=Prorops nasuta TaxID=863751 RepID=UPI0034CECCB8
MNGKEKGEGRSRRRRKSEGWVEYEVEKDETPSGSKEKERLQKSVNVRSIDVVADVHREIEEDSLVESLEILESETRSISKKPGRKRWRKDATVIRLAESESILAYDNYAFQSEQLLTIETTNENCNNDGSTKIQMTSIENGTSNDIENTSPNSAISSITSYQNSNSSHKGTSLSDINSDQAGRMSSKDASSSSLKPASRERKILKKKKKKRNQEKTEEKTEQNIRYISVTVHRSDLLETDYMMKHPMVKVHIVDASSGNYLHKRNDQADKKDYLQPIITGKFDFKEHKSMIPIWEEELIFEYDFERICSNGSNRAIIFFEVIDLPSFAEASFNYEKFGSDGCWYKIAWAFLKPVSTTNNTLYLDKTVRLQLYRPCRSRSWKRFQKHRCEVYSWWKSGIREKYPSSLFVTMKSVDPPKLEPIVYQQLDLVDAPEPDLQEPTSNSITLPKWSRLAAQSCKIPNDLLFETDISENGCFCIAFSNNGKYLACAISDEYDYPIVVHEIEMHKVHVEFSGHKTFIYSLNWSIDDNLLVSVSSDQTARLWDIRERIVQCVQLLPHPSYVYCGKFDSVNSRVVATGCYDRVARIWARVKGSKIFFQLSEELEGHEGYVNSLCFRRNNDLLSADSVGVIIYWTVKTNRKMLLGKEWQILKKIKIREIEGTVINGLLLHPLGSRVVVHSRNNGLRMLDLSTGVVLRKYAGLTNQRIQLMGCISPCGGLIFCGGEDSTINVWSLETGRLLAKYTLERSCRAVTCLDYHPYDHCLAATTFGSPASVKVFRFNKDATTNADVIGLSILHEKDTTMTSFRESNYDGSAVSIVQRTRKLSKLDNNSNRLFSIIEKIDKILLNTSRCYTPETNMEAGLLGVDSESSLNQVTNKGFQMLQVSRRKARKKTRSKSADQRRPKKSFEHLPRIFSDGAATSPTKLDESSPRSSSPSPIMPKLQLSNSDRSSYDDTLPDSGGTYVVEKADFEENNDYARTSGGKSNHYNSNSNISNSDGSMKSSNNVTFSIETEFVVKPPVPKPRKKRIPLLLD